MLLFSLFRGRAGLIASASASRLPIHEIRVHYRGSCPPCPIKQRVQLELRLHAGGGSASDSEQMQPLISANGFKLVIPNSKDNDNGPRRCGTCP